jgi:hypothetical protein
MEMPAVVVLVVLVLVPVLAALTLDGVFIIGCDSVRTGP